MASKKKLTKPMVVLLALFVSACHCQQNRFYIRSSENPDCPDAATASHCKNLSTFVAERNYSTSMVLEFLPGHHYLWDDLEIIGTKQFIMSSYHEEDELGVTIVSNYKSFIFKNVSVVKINSILFRSCGGEYFGAVQLRSVNHSEIINSQWEKSTRSSAVFINDSNTLVSDCQFTSSVCSDCPGRGIHAEHSNVSFSGKIQVSRNKVETIGGGLYIIKSRLHLDGNLTVTHNWGLSGGGMYIVDSTFTATQISFLLTENNGCMLSDGGGFYFERVTAVIAGHAVFAHNSATKNGGGIYILNSQCKFSENATFLNNSAGVARGEIPPVGKMPAAGYGGGIYAMGGAVMLNDIIFFTDNSANKGGALYLEAANFTIAGNVNFNQNFACEGGAVYTNFTVFSLLGVTVFQNNTASEGGAVAMLQGVTSFEEYTSFIGNLAEDGGGIHLLWSKVSFGKELQVIGNIAQGHNGGGFSIYYQSSLLFYSKVIFLLNSAHESGGGIYAKTSSCIFIKTAFFSDNKAGSSGGSISLVGTPNITFISAVDISRSSAGHAGGGIAITSGSVMEMKGNTTIAYNSAENNVSYGGGMFVSGAVTVVRVDNISFSQNSASEGGALYVEFTKLFMSRGIVAFINNTASRGGAIAMENVHYMVFEGYTCIAGNSAKFGGAIFLLLTNIAFRKELSVIGNTAHTYNGGGFNLLLSSTVIFHGNVMFAGNCAEENGGAIALKMSSCIFNEKVVFSENKAGFSGGSISLVKDSNITFLFAVEISSSNAGWAGGGIAVTSSSILEMKSVSSIRMNSAHAFGGAISLDHSKAIIKGRSVVADNIAQYGGGIHAIDSKLVIANNVSLERNFGYIGGGFSLSSSSLLYFLPMMNYNSIQFDSNFASQKGGGIWIEDIPFYSCVRKNQKPIQQCFFYIYLYYTTGCVFCFINNTAVLAGSNLYGGSVDNCAFVAGVESENSFNAVYKTQNESISSSPISSNPRQVCLCTENNEPDCSISNYTTEAFSGQQFSLSLVGVGQRNGTVPTVILSHSDPPSSETIEKASKSCTILNYTLNSEKPLVKLKLYPDSPCHNILSNMLTVLVKINPCPPGFKPQNKTKSCTCDDVLKRFDSDLQCDINSQSFAHKHGLWIDHRQLLDIHKTVIYHPHCPLDYCTQNWSIFTFNSTDNQCRFNRSGLICGACKEGYSLTLGGSKCEKCSHVYLLLFLPLAVAGVVLVFFLLAFRLTVSIGTVNGLIFFANIIETNSSIFLPPESNSVLRVFIAWLNLDLGVNTCLFDGLNMYSKVWLQFVFPFYIFILIGVIIIISQHSALFTKCLGSDPVAVLATLFLLAYTKLFRTVLTVMSFTYIQSIDGSRMTVWLYDGNIRYLSGNHIPLFMFALVVVLLFIIPYTVILLFGPCLQRFSNIRFFSWIDNRRFKPFLHSYYVPLKDKYRCWVGILLVIRFCLLIIFGSNSLGDPSINLFAITAVVIFLLCWRVIFGTVYTNWRLDALELFFIMNLGLFSVSTLYVLNSNANQIALTHTIIGVAFFAFAASLVYHGWRQLTDGKWYTCKNILKSKFQKFMIKGKKISSVQQEHSPPPVPTTFVELREPLLDC